MGKKSIYSGGTIFTMDGSIPRAEAVFVEDGVIKAVGDTSKVKHFVDADTRKIDLNGGFLVPGLIETHNHLSFFAFFLEHCNLGGGACDTVDDAVRRLRSHNAELRNSEYVVGYGFDDTYTAQLRHLNKSDLDKVSVEKPVMVHHMSGHVGYANSRALELLDITKSTQDPPGGWIERDDSGNPTGKLEEMAWIQLVGENLPPPTDPARIKPLIKKAVKAFNAYGIVAVHDAAVGIAGSGEGTVSAYQALERNRELHIRAFLSLMAQSSSNVEPEQIDGVGMGKRRVVAGGVKLFVDGSIQTNTAALLSPYKNTPDFKGELVMSQGEVEEAVLKYHKRGDHISVHANGDAAIEAVVTAFEKAQKVNFREDTRHMVIHCQMAHRGHIDRMKKAGVIPSFFGMHVHYYGDRHVAIFLGQERASRISPCGDAERAGLDFTLHTDTPVMPPWTMESIGTAVTRRTKSGAVLGGDQRISPEKALAAYTTMAAKCSYSENDRGSISVGKLADFTLLSQDITQCDPHAIKETQILKTIVEDETVFEA
jgi:predicted amidohydrolase YtcJ